MIINADKKIDDLKFQIESGITETIDDNYESALAINDILGIELVIKNKTLKW